MARVDDPPDAGLLTEGSRAAVSTRAVCARGGVQSPTIYRLFGDMDGLLDAVAAHEFAGYVADKSARAALPDLDPLTPSELGLMAEWLDRIAGS